MTWGVGVPKVRVVEPTIDQLLDVLLVEWHQYVSDFSYSGSGHQRQSATTRDYSTPSHMDWRNGAEDARADRMQLQSIDEAVQAIPDEPHRWRTALAFHARNLHSGVTVWFSPLMPRTREERDVLIIEARTKFLIELRKRNLL
jgi:hypothetical protein